MERGTEWCTSRINFRFIIIFNFINDIDTGIISCLLKFSDDTKVFANVEIKKLENQDNVEQFRNKSSADVHIRLRKSATSEHAVTSANRHR